MGPPPLRRVLALALVAAALPIHNPHASSAREAAVQLARSGQLPEAIERLQIMQARGATDPLLVPDLLTLLQQSGRSSEAIDLYERTHPADLPSYALLSITRAYRDRQRFDLAESVAREGMRRFADESVWPVLLALILADNGRADEAVRLLSGPTAQGAPQAERLLASGYALRRARRPFEALTDYAAVERLDPTNREARDSVQAILRDMRAPWGASGFAALPPPLALASEMAAAEVRWGEADQPQDPRRRFEGTDRALASLDTLIAQADADKNSALGISLRLDRMVALRDRVRMTEVVAEATTLRRDGVELPPYVRHALADALLYLRQPNAAMSEYTAVLAADPNNAEAQAGQFYAAVEAEDFATAYRLVDARLAAQRTWQQYADDPTRYPRDEHLDALLQAADARFYGDQPTAAWERISPERDAAPANQAVRLSAAAIMNARDWPREAEQESRIALSLAPTVLAAQISVADIALPRKEFAEAQARILELTAIYPENLEVQRLERELAAQTGWRLDLDVKPTDETGGGANNSGHEITSSARVTSPLIDYRWRLFAEDSFADAHPPEGYVKRQRIEGGLSMTLPDLSATLSFHQDLGTLDRTGATASLDWQPSDHMGFAVSASKISAETPLRALLHGITADAVSTRIAWTGDEAHSASFSAAWMPFSDGNRRATLDAHYLQKVLELPHFGLTAQGELYASANSLADAAYYNPRADGSATVGLVAEHVVWRRYEHSLTQVLTLNGGMYGERDFRGGPIGLATYEHRWRLDPWTEISYGVSVGRQMYDGLGAHTLGAFVALHHNL